MSASQNNAQTLKKDLEEKKNEKITKFNGIVCH